ncbi:MAG TPA: ATP-binding protein, partial [Mycobacterium sp.]|nr:ATP-binding protein [Mycobacterium sp.]
MAARVARHGANAVRTNPSPRTMSDRRDRHGGRPAFVGRDDTLAAGIDALHEPSLVFIEGEAGIGKSRLVRECLRAPGIANRRVLTCTCPPLDKPFPLGAVVDGLRRMRPELAGLRLSALAGALRPLFPEWRDQLPAALETLDDSRETRHRLLAALTEL